MDAALALITQKATQILGSAADAQTWLDTPAMALDNQTPRTLLSTPAGVDRVRDHLTRLEYGVHT